MEAGEADKFLEGVRRVLEREDQVAYALVFGSTARGSRHGASDIDVAIGLQSRTPGNPQAIGALVSRLESASGARVDLVVLDDVPPAVAYRVFRDGRVMIERDHAALAARKARAILDYLDFKPTEERCAAGVLRVAAAHGR